MGFDAYALRAQFPALDQEVNGRPLVYLDSGASAQKPLAVLEAMRHLDERDYANVHRGVHALSQRATAAYEAVREKVRRLLNAPSADEIVFTRGTTESINLVAQSWGRSQLGPGDEVVISAMEHHANIVPWQMICQERGALLRVIDVLDDGTLDLEQARRLLSSPKVKVLALIHVSNVLGTINPVAELGALARAQGAVVLLDGAQAAPHGEVDVQALGCDFYAFSAHKLFGPTGVGVLWGRGALLAQMPPVQGGGDMIKVVSFEGTTYAEPPQRFEAGTPNITGVVGLGAAIDFYLGLDLAGARAHEAALLEDATARLSALEGLRILGPRNNKASVISFVVDGVHANDLGMILDQGGVAVRTGHHCAQPLMRRFGVSATARASISLYNTPADIDALVEGVKLAVEMLR